MKSATALLLTLCLSVALVQAGTTSQSDLSDEVRALRATVEKLKLMESRLSASELKVKDLRAELDATKTDLILYQRKTEELEKKLKDESKVAFSVGLTRPIGPFPFEMKLIYNKVITNIGNAYNVSSGFFTAPVRGVYFFRFNAVDDRRGKHVGVALHKNDQRVLLDHALIPWDEFERVSSGVILELSAGDVVHMRLPVGLRVADWDTWNYNIFSGFLLFPM